MLPNGIIVHFYRAFVGRRHDSALYHTSQIANQLINVRDRQGNVMQIFADSAYGLQPFLITSFKNANKTPAQLAFNANMNSVRQCVEWGFGKLTKTFTFLYFKKNLKVLLQLVPSYYRVTVLLCNAHTCLYGSQTNDFFATQPPTIEEYFRWSLRTFYCNCDKWMKSAYKVHNIKHKQFETCPSQQSVMLQIVHTIYCCCFFLGKFINFHVENSWRKCPVIINGTNLTT